MTTVTRAAPELPAPVNTAQQVEQFDTEAFLNAAHFRVIRMRNGRRWDSPEVKWFSTALRLVYRDAHAKQCTWLIYVVSSKTGMGTPVPQARWNELGLLWNKRYPKRR